MNVSVYEQQTSTLVDELQLTSFTFNVVGQNKRASVFFKRNDAEKFIISFGLLRLKGNVGTNAMLD